MTDFEELTPAEKILHLQDLWDRIASQPQDVPVTDAMRAELELRLQAHRAAPEESAPWSEVKARVRKVP